MVTNELLEYIKKENVRNIPIENIKKTLIANGWPTEDVEEAFSKVFPKAQGLVSVSIKTVPSAMPKTVEEKTEPVMNSTFVPVNSTTTASPRTVSNPNFYSNKNPSVMIKKKKSSFFKILLVLILLLCGGAGAYGYYIGYFTPPETSLIYSIDAVSKIKSVSYDEKMTIDLTSFKNENLLNTLANNVNTSKIITLTSNGSYDRNELNNLKSRLALSASVGDTNASVEFRLLNNILYGAVTKIPKVDFLKDYGSFENKWVSFPLNNLNQIAGSMNLSGINKNLIDNLTAEQKKQLSDTTKNASFIKVIKRLPNESVDGVSNIHFIFEPDFAGIETYVQNMRDYLQVVYPDNKELGSIKIDYIKNIEKTIKSFTGEVWIGRWDHLPRKIVLDISLVDPKNINNGEIKINTISNFTNWDKKIQIDIPENSSTFEEVMTEILDVFQAKQNDKDLQTNLTNISSLGESYLKEKNRTSYSGFCSSAQVKKINDQVKIVSPNNTGLLCRDSKAGYVTWVAINENSFYCMDKYATLKVLPKIPEGFMCK